MPIIINPDEMTTHLQGVGWQIVTLADKQALGLATIVARRWSLKPNAHSTPMAHSDIEQLLFVVRGSGMAVVGSEKFPMEPESMLWLESGDCYHFEAGMDGLELLQGYPQKD